jgi:hypothetical protein
VPEVVKVFVAFVLEVPPLQAYVLPPEAVSVRLPHPVELPEIEAIGMALTAKLVVLFAVGTLVHPFTPPD